MPGIPLRANKGLGAATTEDDRLDRLAEVAHVERERVRTVAVSVVDHERDGAVDHTRVRERVRGLDGHSGIAGVVDHEVDRLVDHANRATGRERGREAKRAVAGRGAILGNDDAVRVQTGAVGGLGVHGRRLLSTGVGASGEQNGDGGNARHQEQLSLGTTHARYNSINTLKSQ